VTNVLTSSAVLTFLLAIGLVFFIKASVKARIEQLSFVLTEPEAEFLPKFDRYLVDRAYRLVDVSDQTGVVYEGAVAPSWFMAVFLSSLAAGGFLCLGLVLSYLLPAIGNLWLLLGLLAPLAGFFYWRKSARPEQVKLAVKDEQSQKIVTITGHRDELAILGKTLAVQPLEKPGH
jgi:Cofactor assembly of complex C subunit B